MLSFLFPRLTPSRASRGSALFATLVGEARRPHWYVEGEVPDTLDGRFAVLATLVALATVRLERGDETAQLESVGLAERFVEAMDAEHRELGIGDPTLGKTVRKLVGALARRVELWRRAIDATVGQGVAEPVARGARRGRTGPLRGGAAKAAKLSASDPACRGGSMIEDFRPSVALDGIRDGERVDLSRDDERRRSPRGSIPRRRLESHASLARTATRAAPGRVAPRSSSAAWYRRPVAAHLVSFRESPSFPSRAPARARGVRAAAGDCDVGPDGPRSTSARRSPTRWPQPRPYPRRVPEAR